MELRSHVEFKSASRRDPIGSAYRDVVFWSAGTARLKRVTLNQISHEVIEDTFPNNDVFSIETALRSFLISRHRGNIPG
jgi:hypothetical protein